MSWSPSPDNYLLGRGAVFFDKFDDNGDKTGELHLGNAPAFSITPELEKLEHFSSLTGLKVKDKEVIVQAKLICNFTLDEITKENLALAFLATSEAFTQTAGTITDLDVVAKTLGAYYELGKRHVSDVVVKNTLGTVTYTEGDDYTVQYETGRIYITTDGLITKDQELKVTFDYADITDGVRLDLATESKIEGQLRFMGDPAEGEAYELVFFKASLSASGEVAMISEDWATIAMTAECLKDPVLNKIANVYTLTGWVPTP